MPEAKATRGAKRGRFKAKNVVWTTLVKSLENAKPLVALRVLTCS
jgi:hypothetical protein